MAETERSSRFHCDESTIIVKCQNWESYAPTLSDLLGLTSEEHRERIKSIQSNATSKKQQIPFIVIGTCCVTHICIFYYRIEETDEIFINFSRARKDNQSKESNNELFMYHLAEARKHGTKDQVAQIDDFLSSIKEARAPEKV